MALTRAQLLSGNNNNGVTLPGQPQGVIAGAGINISTTGIISVDSSSVTGLVKLNDPFAYNAYVWPNADGTAGEFLQTDGAGNLDWGVPTGLAVVTVQPQPAPSPPDIGELWFDCSTGTLNVYQNCLGSPSPNWFNVAQPGKPVDPAQTGAVPAFTGGNGTQATPYLMTVTSTGVGTTVAIINTVTVNGLAPFQYVPIVDLNAVINGGRFSFTNYYANGSGQLIFNTVFSDLPTSTPGQSYVAAIRVGYATAYIQATVSVVAPLTLSAGTITGTPTVGTAVAYTPGVASGGTGPYTYSYQWKANGTNIGSASSNPAFTPTAAQAGQTLSVLQTVTDNAGATASNTTTASAQTATASFPSPVWNPGPSGGMNTNPGGISGAYTGAGPITVTGCIEASVNGQPYATGTQTITSGQTLAIRWRSTPACGGANTNTPLTGTVSDGTYTNSYNLAVNRVPSPAITDITSTNVGLGATVSQGITPAISGLNSVAYVTAGAGSTGTGIGVSLTPGGPFTPIPAAGSATFPIANGQTLYVEQTAGSAVNTAPGYTAVVKVGDADGVLADSFTYFAQTVSSAVFPGLTFDNGGSPNAAPETLNGYADPGTLGNLYGFVSSNAWPTGLGTTLSSPASGGNPTMKMRVGAAAYATSGVAVASGQILNLAWNQAYLDTVTSGNLASGSITGVANSVTYTNTFSFTVKRTANFTVPASPSGAAGTITISQQTPDDYNVPVKVYQTAGTLTAVTVSINGASAVSLPTSSATALTINPGDTVAYSATAPAGTGTYTTQLHIGDTVKTWSYQVTVTPTVNQPDILNPNDGATNLNPALNSPAGITIDTDVAGQPGGFVTNYGGTQTKSQWFVYKALPYNPTTSAITAVSAAPIYSNNLTSSNGFQPGYPATNAFNGNTTTYASSTYLPGDNVSRTATLTWTGNVPVTTSARIYAYEGTRGGGATEIYSYAINGGSFTGTASTWALGWIDVTSQVTGGFLTQVQCRCTFQAAIGAAAPQLNAIEVDGVILTDGEVKLTLTDGTDLADMVVGDTVVQDSTTIPVTSAIQSTSNVTATYINSGSTNAGSGGPCPNSPFARPGGNPFVAGYCNYTGGNNQPITSTVNFNPGGKPVYIAGRDRFDTLSINGVSVTPTITSVYDFGGGYSLDFLTVTGINYTITSITNTATTGNTYMSGIWYGDVPPGITGQDLTFANSQDLNLFRVNDAVTSSGGAVGAVYSVADIASNKLLVGVNSSQSGTLFATTETVTGPTTTPTGTITSIGATSLVLNGGVTTWKAGAGKKAIDTTRTITPPAPPALPPATPDNTKYQAVTGFNPLTVTGTPFDSALIPQANLAVSSKYYASVIYTGSGATPVDSQAATWSSFTTASAFIPAPGSALNGGYFGGQINDGGIIYNLIVAPAASGQNTSGLAWKNANTIETFLGAQNEVYGFPMSQVGNAAGAATYPAFHWARNLSINTYSDWYIPARNELEVLYYFLKPDVASGGTANNTAWGSNPNAVAPEPVSTNYTASNPAQTTSTLFRTTGGTEAFSNALTYWSATEQDATKSRGQNFDTGAVTTLTTKTTPCYARAIRREYANAPVAIGAAFGGGYFAGQYQDGGQTYNLIVAPVTSGSLFGQYGGATASGITWKNSDSGDTNPPSQDTVCGKSATDTFGAIGAPTYPMFAWCYNDATGPNGNRAPGAGIGGFTDWYIPAKNELEIIVNNLGAGWTTGSAFKASQAQVFTSGDYWSATEATSNVNTAWKQDPSNGAQVNGIKSATNYARAVRRQLA